MNVLIHASLKRMSDIVFLALVLWREARGESTLAKVAVAHTVLNRVQKPGWWGSDVTSVIFKKWQYSSMTDPKDKQLTAWPPGNEPAWIECLEISADVLEGMTTNPVPLADSYYDDSIPAPKWANEANFIAKIGRLNFHNVDKEVP